MTPALTVEQPKPSPMAPVESPAPVEPKPVRVHKVRPVAQARAQAAPAAIEDSRSVRLANEIINLPLQERLEWSKQEFAKRGIGNVHLDQ